MLLTAVEDALSLKALIQELEEAIADLEQYAYSQFDEMFGDSFSYMSDYFISDSAYKPRACIKVITEEGVAPLVRRPEPFAFIEGLSAAPSENSAFDDIMGEPITHYMCNDIPKQLSLGHYKNNRVDMDLFREMLKQYPEGHMPDEDWKKCWKKVHLIVENREEVLPPLEPPIEMCYRSTLVVPMSLVTKELSEDFIDQFEISADAGTAVFGFLCFDHPEAGFFEAEDIDFGYVLADLLSLYIIQQLMYTDYSSVYRTAQLAVAKYASA
ncbi:MAG: hypothetical protein AAGN15_21985 [Cyanobacteria bacterium J06581_3]